MKDILTRTMPLLHHGHDEHGGRVHTHEDGTTHAHPEYTHEELIKLLEYMESHNAQHAEELHELAHQIEGDAHEYIHEAVKEIKASNEKLAKAIDLLKEL